MEEKTFMLIGASKPNVPIITMARNIGYKVVVTDINPKAEGLKYGDYNYNVSAKDIDILVRIAFMHKVNCVYSGTDINLSVGVINTVMGIEGFPLIVGLASEYKNIFRKLAEEADMPVINGYVVRTEAEALSALKKIDDDAVIKAINLSSSKGVKKVCSEEEVINGFSECHNLSNEKEVIIEEYIKGSCHDVNGLVIKGEFYPCGIVDRSFIEHSNYFVQKQVTCPTILSKDVQKMMYDTMAKFCKYSKIHTSPVKADFLFDGNQIYLLEFGPRFHGEMGFLYMIPGAISIRAMEAYLKFRYSGILDLSLLEENIIDEAVCKADIIGEVKSNYDVKKYLITFKNKGSIEVTLRSKYDEYKTYLREYLQNNKDYPRSIFVEVTPLCNLKCVFCPCYIPGEEVTKDRRTNYLSFKNFRNIIEPIKGKFNFQICFTYSGEPLLNPEVFKMVKYLKENNIPCVIHSNAMPLTKQKTKELLESGLDRFIVSFDGATKKTYEEIKRGAKFEVVVNNIKNLIEERNNQDLEKPFVEMQMVVTKTNIHESKLFEDLSKEIGVDNAYFKTLLVFQDTKNKEYMREVEDLFVDNEVARYKRDKNGNLVLKDAEGCPELQNCVITCDGDVVPCCFDVHGKYCLGNAIETSLKEIWDSQKYEVFREEKMRLRKLPICSFCNTSAHILKRV